MTSLGQRTLIQHLVDRESLDTLAREGLDVDCIPTEELRKVYLFCIDYFHASGRSKAPSVAVVRSEYGDLLDDHEIDLNEDPEDSIEWAIDDLKGTYTYKHTAAFNKRLAAAMSEAETADRLDVLAEHATELVALSMRLESHEAKVDAREGMVERMQAYEARALDRDAVYGMRLGFPQIDAYTRGIHPGELAVLAAPAKTGKSYALDRVALKEWQAGKVCVLYTLENSVEMTLDRIACMATSVSSRAWQHGECSEGEVELVRAWIEEIAVSEIPMHVIQPPPGQRSVETMVRQAQLLNADSLVIDQLTFIEPEDERAPRHLQIREITHTLKSMISTGRDRMPCLLAHQINREGVKAADKVGYLEMSHLAEGCFDDQTEVMTEGGWKFFSDVVPGERVATLSPDLDVVYQVPTAEISYHYEGDLWTYESSGVNFAVTPNHRFLVKDAWNRDGDFRFEQVRDLTNERYAIPRQINPIDALGEDVWVSAGTLDGQCRPPFLTGKRERWTDEEDDYLRGAWTQDVPLWQLCQIFPFRSEIAIKGRAQRLALRRTSPIGSEIFRHPSDPLPKTRLTDFAAFVGLWLAEGKKGYNGRTVKVTQVKPEGVQWIDFLFQRLQWPHSRSVRAKKGEVVWTIPSSHLRDYLNALKGEGNDLYIPKESIGEWGREALESLLEGLNVGDGSWSTQWSRFDYYTTSSKTLADDVQRLILHLGQTGNVKRIAKVGTKFLSPSGNISTLRYDKFLVRQDSVRRHNYIYPGRIKKVPYSGMVYCFNVPNSTLLVRRNGVPMWSGNSEVERTCDWVFGLHRSEAERAIALAKFQTLACRREETRHFQLRWNVNGGQIYVRSEIDLEGNVISPRFSERTAPVPEVTQ